VAVAVGDQVMTLVLCCCCCDWNCDRNVAAIVGEQVMTGTWPCCHGVVAVTGMWLQFLF
jgi:hypothetical protein